MILYNLRKRKYLSIIRRIYNLFAQVQQIESECTIPVETSPIQCQAFSPLESHHQHPHRSRPIDHYPPCLSDDVWPWCLLLSLRWLKVCCVCVFCIWFGNWSTFLINLWKLAVTVCGYFLRSELKIYYAGHSKIISELNEYLIGNLEELYDISII